MAPLLSFPSHDSHNAVLNYPGVIWHVKKAARRSATDSSNFPDVSGATSGPVHIGIGLGVGAVIFASIIFVVILILRKKAEHGRGGVELEQSRVPTQSAEQPTIREVRRPVRIARCRIPAPLNSQEQWGALSSDEKIHECDALSNTRNFQRCNSISITKPICQRSILLNRIKIHSASTESLRKRATGSPSHCTYAKCFRTPKKRSTAEKSGFRKTITVLHPAQRCREIDFDIPASPKPRFLHSSAIRTPGTHSAAIANDDRPKPPCSVVVGELHESIPENLISGQITHESIRPSMRTRSVSLGVPQSQPPSKLDPPVPISLQSKKDAENGRQRQIPCISRLSSSSQYSTGSSLLIKSPIMTVRGDQVAEMTDSSPILEKVPADDDTAQIKLVSSVAVNGQLQNTLVTGPRPMDEPRLQKQNASLEEVRVSIHINVGSYIPGISVEDLADRQVSLMSTDSADSYGLSNKWLSIPRILTADRVGLSRVSSFNTLTTSTALPPESDVQKNVRQVSTLRKQQHRQSSVTASGSPTKRSSRTLKTPTIGLTSSAAALTRQSISRNIVSLSDVLSRQSSTSTQGSSFSRRSSDDNPFQWDTQSMPLTIPSALKGSPNAKGAKGNRRHNCVRISIFTRQILGPSPSRPTSPGIMHDVDGHDEEEEMGVSMEETEERRFKNTVAAGMRFVPPYNAAGRRFSGPSSSGSFAKNLPIQPPRASLTPSSPTISTWPAENHRPGANDRAQSRETSGTHLPSSHTVSTAVQNKSRQSVRSSISASVSNPSFLSPTKPAITSVQIDAIPLPEFCTLRPPTDEPEEMISSPFVLHTSLSDDDVELPSTPPLPISKSAECNLTRPAFGVPKVRSAGYDLSSPVPPEGAVESNPEELKQSCFDDGERSLAYFPLALNYIATCDNESKGNHVTLLRCPPVSSRSASMESLSCSPTSRSCATVEAEQIPELPPRFPIASKSEKYLNPRRRAEKLSSANPSAIMGPILEVPPNIGFPRPVPVLPPTIESIEPAEISSLQPQQQKIFRYAVKLDPLLPAPPLSIQDKRDASYPRNLSGRNRISASLGAPSEPGRSVLKNATALRRINSEIDTTSRNSRRYTRIRREASPLLSCIGSPDPSESYYGLFDFGFGHPGSDTFGGASEDDDIVVGSALDDIDFAQFERRFEGVLAGFDAESPSTARRRSLESRRASQGVWEEGEEFWEKWRGLEVTPSSTVGEPITPTKKVVPQKNNNLQTPVGELHTPVMDRITPGSITKTPQSLYDSDGFLRTY